MAEESNDSRHDLQPTLWRTARSLANVKRLKMLHHIYRSKSCVGVSQLAAEVGISTATASAYLRAMNARGIISVRRDKSFVFYGMESDRSLPVAMSIQCALFGLFREAKLPTNWIERLLPLLRAYSHPRRELLILILKQVPVIGYSDLHRRSGLHKAAFERHFGYLVRAGIVEHLQDGLYRLAPQRDSLASVFLRSL